MERRANPPAGRLSSRIQLATNYREVPNLDDVGTTFAWDRIAEVWGNITPIGTQAWISGVQIGEEITHRITIRWRDDIDQLTKIVRETRRPNDSIRREVYQVKRVGELNGEKRFVVIEVKLESQHRR